MNKKILAFNTARKKFSPYTVTLVSGSFEPFNEYYFRFLRWASQQNRPLVVIVQKDEMVLMRRGLLPLSTRHKTRAEIISSLEFVDCVIIANKTAHNRESIEQLQPKIIAFQNDNFAYRKTIAKGIKHLYPGVRIKIAPFRFRDFEVLKKRKRTIKVNSNKIATKLLELAKYSKGRASKISAILVDNKNQILAETSNSAEEEHAEILLLYKAKSEKIDHEKCCIYVLIPPCLMCARKIAKSSIKKVFYLLPYGDGEGIEYLIRKNIKVKKM